IARSNIDGTPGTFPAATGRANADREMSIYNSGNPDVFEVDDIASLIQNGENIFAIEIHRHQYLTDVSVIPFLTFGMTDAPLEPKGIPEILSFSVSEYSFHTNYKIKSGGETIVLTYGSGVVCDSLYTGEIAEDISRGRKPDGGDELVFFSEPTPGKSNTAPAITGYTGEVSISVPGGFYDSGVSVEFSTGSENAVIRFTLDGSVPTDSSAVYTAGISVDNTTVVRVRAFETGMFPGPVSTNTYIINEDIELPVISLSTNPENLWDPDTGIYVKGNSNARGGYPCSPTSYVGNYNEDWERPIHIEFYEPDGTQGFSIDAGVKMHGKNSRAHPQKSMAVFARPEYGYDEIDYRIFPDLPITKFTSILLRVSGNNQSTNRATLIRDGLCQTIMGQLDLETQAYRPSVVFLNGVYWGIHNIREKVNEDCLAAHHGVDPDRVDILDDYHAVFVNNYPSTGELNAYISNDKPWTCFIVEGTADHYNALLRYMLDNDESDPEVYEYLKTQIDIENFIDYMAAQIYISNPDGPGHNTKMWRPQSENGRWRWLTYDVERGFGIQENPFGIPGPAHVADLTEYYIRYKQTAENRSPDANFFMYSLLANDEFKAEFVNRYADHLNTIFSTEQVIPIIERLAGAVESEIPRHLATHDFAVKSIDTWRANVDYIKTFAELRPQYTRQNIINNLGLSGSADVTLDVADPAMGGIQISSLVIKEFPWTGMYFMDVPIQLTAIPRPGYAFAGWTGSQESDSAVITVTLSEAVSLTANFVEDSTAKNTVVINEINFHSSPLFDPDDWVELYNAYDIPIDVSGWILKDINDENNFSITDGITIPAGGYFVLARNTDAFGAVFPWIDNVAGDFRFGLNNAGDTVRLYNTAGEIIDSLTYADTAPWPADADGSGQTLSLISPELDNTVAENWTASAPKGTPGIGNDKILSVDDDGSIAPEAYSLGQNYPNPFNPVTTIPFSVPESGRITIAVYSITGQRIAVIVDGTFAPGQYRAVFTAKNFASGMYFYRIEANGYSETKSMMLLK
ncbi:CotH kinase family protein, partial [Candidatus Latescibacterota bacterium]